MSRGADTATRITEARLIELRRDGKSCDHGFVDPDVLRRCTDALDRRGEAWAAAILGRDISRRSLGVPHRPYLYAGEPHALVAADGEEDLLTIVELDPDRIVG
ncbi:hypothetical protein [Mycobacterium avium]|uniref:hypothetical protein n=2 Tax=Mycobacterium avium TaxID=1764 RepID=UPI001CD9A58B|nr:hypothetical protein [Mycobacterium avium]MCA2240546.1 hypothetical protein [Mycobacterium avium]MCA2259128.1 hypothetical protein [Mycobacterium avium]MCA2280033.1 hypothetical protein [Mycobacterium avium]MCA2290024.1 hypothetical protein [Mycobacterium avium]MCA2330847.1 hypothetical protein [Mycobacterium avium]